MYTLCILCTHYNHVPICTHECVRCSLFLLLLNIQYIFGLWFISVAFISLSLCVCVIFVWFTFKNATVPWLFISQSLCVPPPPQPLPLLLFLSLFLSFFLIIEVPALWTAPLSHHSLSPWTFFCACLFQFVWSVIAFPSRSLSHSLRLCLCLPGRSALTHHPHARALSHCCCCCSLIWLFRS